MAFVLLYVAMKCTTKRKQPHLAALTEILVQSTGANICRVEKKVKNRDMYGSSFLKYSW